MLLVALPARGYFAPVEHEANKRFIEALTRSQIYQDYERAFSKTTGLPLTLRPVESWHMAQHGKKAENPFCTLMAENNRACAACLETQQKINEGAGVGPPHGEVFRRVVRHRRAGFHRR
ncbi:MAG: hypothetical protein V9H26_12210 [Verrucomicrobiota bacterium]